MPPTEPADRNPGCLGALLRLFGRGGAPPPQQQAQEIEDAAPAGPPPYRVRDDFLSPAEASFFHSLCRASEGRAVVCPKVGLGDVFFVARPHENRGARNRIAQKHVDFMLCEPGTMRPLLGVELDDASHAHPDRQERDGFVDGAFAAAGLPLLRVPARAGGHDVRHLTELLEPHLTNGSIAPPLTADAARHEADPAAPPTCPKCGVPMVLRTAARGEAAGRQFFGCANYPRCRETRPAGGAA